jgi:glycosyltransferase involved in cell wall biosynthesis
MGRAYLMSVSVTAVIPTIPTRRTTLLPLALQSVLLQTYPITAISIRTDLRREGAAATRARALGSATTEWVAFLDDDDEWYPQHVERLLAQAHATDADYVYSYWDTTRTANYFGDPPKLHGPDEHYGHYGREFDPDNPTDTTSMVLVRTDLAQRVGFRQWNGTDLVSNEDHWFMIDCLAAGAKIVHLPEQTWYWRHHDGNTSGRADRC